MRGDRCELYTVMIVEREREGQTEIERQKKVEMVQCIQRVRQMKYVRT